jgi:hypothetical protein
LKTDYYSLFFLVVGISLIYSSFLSIWLVDQMGVPYFVTYVVPDNCYLTDSCEAPIVKGLYFYGLQIMPGGPARIVDENYDEGVGWTIGGYSLLVATMLAFVRMVIIHKKWGFDRE